MALLRQRYPALEYKEEGCWIRIPSYPLPAGWNRTSTDVAFQIPASYLGTPPYGFYVPAGLLFNQAQPLNYTEPAPNQPPFQGTWGFFSWQVDGQWRATTDLVSGATLLNWVMGFTDRFRAGR